MVLFRPFLVDPELLQLVPQRPEGDAQLRGGAGLVVAVVLQRLLDGLALDFLDEAGQGAAGGLARVDLAWVQLRGGGLGGRASGVLLRRLWSASAPVSLENCLPKFTKQPF